jgi:hypothetical protein
MKTSILKFTTLSLMLVLLLGIAGCDKQEMNGHEWEISGSIFFENFYKTVPFINEYLSSLPRNWNDKRKLQALTEWLNLHPCVIEAKLEFVGTHENWLIPVPPGRYGTIALLLDDNGMTRELTLNIFGKISEPLRVASFSYVRPKQVRVGFHKSDITTTRDVFDFINLFCHNVLNAFRLGAGRGYLSIMSADRLGGILDILNAKPYLSRVHGYVLDNRMCILAANYRFCSVHIDSYIVIDVTMGNMANRNYQADWLRFMSDYNFFEGNTHQAWFIIDFEVPDGREKKWIEKFNSHKSVLWATRGYGFREIN